MGVLRTTVLNSLFSGGPLGMRGHSETHRSERSGWLRAAVLGANDGIVSTASLMLGVAATEASNPAVGVAGFAGLVAGALSMALGEYVSVSSQQDAEFADIEREKQEQLTQPVIELEELRAIYMKRGLDEPLASQVAERLMKVDPLGTHLRDELGLTDEGRARPLQAGLVSAVSFASGAALPLLALFAFPGPVRSLAIGASALALLAGLGALGGKLGGANPWRAMIRVFVGGTLAMALTMVIGRLVGGAVG
ncbi:MAG: VIT1/CCC1 transporter family protein [Myxococcaceae bacterium]